MEQIMWPNEGRYRDETFFTNPITGLAPNWLIFLKMQDCHYCDILAPNADILAREFHKPDSQNNYIVATIDCSQETGIFMC